MKEFFEKRWWGGIGVMIGIAAVVLNVLQYQGISISWVHVSIAANIILAITLTMVVNRARKWERKYEDARGRLGETMKFLEKQKRTIKRYMKRKRVLLPDPNYMWKLNIDNALLTQLHGQAHGLATTKFHDAKLGNLDILVYPYQDDRVSIHFGFYSPWADRGCTYIVGEIGDMTESQPHIQHEWERVTFDELPWLRDPNWSQFLKKSCEKVGPLPQVDWTHYHLHAVAYWEPQWSTSFTDGVTGKEFNFSWDGKGEPIPEE